MWFELMEQLDNRMVINQDNTLKDECIKIAIARYKDLLIGALYELKSITNDFDDVCRTIGITNEERKYFDM